MNNFDDGGLAEFEMEEDQNDEATVNRSNMAGEVVNRSLFSKDRSNASSYRSEDQDSFGIKELTNKRKQ